MLTVRMIPFSNYSIKFDITLHILLFLSLSLYTTQLLMLKQMEQMEGKFKEC